MSLGVHLDQAEISQIQEELDYDHSGCVSFAEFAAGMLKDDDVRSRVHGGGSGAWWQFGGRGGGSTVAAAVRWQCAWRGDLTISRALRGGCTTLRRARVLRRGDHPGLAGLPTHGRVGVADGERAAGRLRADALWPHRRGHPHHHVRSRRQPNGPDRSRGVCQLFRQDVCRAVSAHDGQVTKLCPSTRQVYLRKLQDAGIVRAMRRGVSGCPPVVPGGSARRRPRHTLSLWNISSSAWSRPAALSIYDCVAVLTVLVARVHAVVPSWHAMADTAVAV
eukprot:4850662-Prymnesium_polylepis.3